MSKVFGSIYADAYDVLYHDKDYVAECDLIERLFQTYADGSTNNVLDLGCGTGSHALLLAQRGYQVVGVDCSADMLAHARIKGDARLNSDSVCFHQGDIRSINLHRHFDAALMMFAVLGYQLETADVLAALRTARQHLRPDGLLLFDVWYGPAVLHLRPSQRIKIIPISGGQILRVTSGDLDTRRHVCTVQYRVWRLEEDRLIASTEESHVVRYFFPMELEFLLESSGFVTVQSGMFPKFDQTPDETSWNVLWIARAT